MSQLWAPGDSSGVPQWSREGGFGANLSLSPDFNSFKNILNIPLFFLWSQ